MTLIRDSLLVDSFAVLIGCFYSTSYEVNATASDQDYRLGRGRNEDIEATSYKYLALTFYLFRFALLTGTPVTINYS